MDLKALVAEMALRLSNRCTYNLEAFCAMVFDYIIWVMLGCEADTN